MAESTIWWLLAGAAVAVTQLAQTSLRSLTGKLELDKTFEERDIINAQVVQAIDEAALNWGAKVLRYQIKDLAPPKEILHALQAQIRAERGKRAVDAYSKVANDATTTLIVPSNMTEVSALIGSAMRMVQGTKAAA